jgi:predicted SAM-dependent methyltransferase
MNIHNLYAVFFRLFRRKRMQRFVQAFRVTPQTRILDVGGTPHNWKLISVQPQVTFLNLSAPPHQHRWVVADGCHLPFPDQAFEIVYSNSVIEHLFTQENQVKFAQECRRVGRSYHIQTPNRRFFVEPHLLTPFIHWLPKRWQRPLLRNATVWGWLTRPSAEQCQQFLQEVRLLDEAELAALFPEADIWKETVAGMTKSIMAVKNQNPDKEN